MGIGKLMTELEIAAKLDERRRCEQIIMSYMKRHADDVAKQWLLKSILRRIREKEKTSESA